MNKREFRNIRARELRVSTNDKGQRVLAGYASIFNSLSEDLGCWREQILPGAFSKCLASNPDIVCLRDHNPTLLLGRTKSGTLRVSQDDIGLRFECDLPETTQANDLVASIERGDVDGCSFGMYCTSDNWRDDNGMTVRDVIEAEVFDCSVVTYPAYPATAVSLRSLFPDGGIEPPAKESRADGCTCECDPCKAGNCADCTGDPCDCDGCTCNESRSMKMRVRIASSL